MSTLNRKAWGDLSRHRARTLLTVFTLSIAITSLGFLAVPSLLNTAMNRQVSDSHLFDVGITTRDLDLTPAELGELGRLPGVAAVSPVDGYVTKATSAAGTQNVGIFGGDLAAAPVDTVPLMSGRMPGPGEVLADAANGRATDYDVPVGGTIRVLAADGRLVPLRVSGTGMNLAATPKANGSTTPVFYASAATVDAITGARGYNYLGFRLTDDSTARQSLVIAEVRAYLTARTGSDPITALPDTRALDQWPGKSTFGHIMALLYIITILAFASALFLISATMNTLIAEQASEIAILKSLGGRRRQIGGVIVRTTALLGGAGAVLGTLAGIGIAYLLARSFAQMISDVNVGFGVSVPVVVTSLVLGPALAVAASLPALRRALRRPVADIMAGRGTVAFGAGWLDRLATRGGARSWIGLSGGTRMGIRNTLRQKRRSMATIAQVAVAAGLAIGLLALGQSVSALITRTEGQLRFGIGVGLTSGSRPFGGQAVRIAAGTPGVTGAQPVETSSVRYAGQDYQAEGLGTRPFYSYRLSAGRWFTAADAAESRTAILPVILGPAVARTVGASVGQVLTIGTPAGDTRVQVVGLDTVYNNSGDEVYLPLPALERLDGQPGAANSLWLTTASSGHAAIDRTAAAVANRLTAAGYRVGTTDVYVAEADATSTVTTVLAIVQILGLLVVAITLMGLVSALSMGVFERTREIGILRCAGARARQIRRVFSAEAMVLAAVGWVVAVPLGWLIYEGLSALIQHNSDITLPREFPAVIPLGTLAALVVLTLIVIRGPLRRATRVQPGIALRYQ
ncbi:MAG: FtsX-like permease family protein [Streptosporangiaceae bacterium]|nr:FtsX-like permease family protein [Streptosporangiaceae bacterium]